MRSAHKPGISQNEDDPVFAYVAVIAVSFFSNGVVLAWNSLEPAAIEAPTSQLFRE